MSEETTSELLDFMSNQINALEKAIGILEMQLILLVKKMSQEKE